VAQVTVIGTGLIGPSLGLALKASSLRDLTVVGTDAEHSARSGAQRKNAFDKVENRLGNAIEEADIIVLATPVLAMRDLMEGMSPYLPEGCVITDVGSTKTQVLQWADELLPDSVDFVGGHPMAGRETPGPENADGTLFAGKPYCVIPSPKASQRAVGEITTLAEAVGAVPYFISMDEHDSFVAAVSHLPFVLSTALVGCTSKSANWADIGQLASSGYRDITRLSSRLDQGLAIAVENASFQPRAPGVAAREEAVACWGADGRGRMGVGERDPLSGKTVQVGRRDR